MIEVSATEFSPNQNALCFITVEVKYLILNFISEIKFQSCRTMWQPKWPSGYLFMVFAGDLDLDL